MSNLHILLYPILVENLVRGSLALLGLVALGLLIVLPLYGVLVRFRANYAPRGIALDSESDVQPRVGPVVNGYFQMLLRVIRIEGFAGLYKGIIPIIIFNVIFWIHPFFWMNNIGGYGTGLLILGDAGLSTAYASFVAVVTLPLKIIINRAITTPYKLPTWNARIALTTLLSPYERQRPWMLYFTPGLLIAQLIYILYKFLIVYLSGLLLELVDRMPHRPDWLKDLDAAHMTAYVFIVVLSMIILCPLEVMATRLSLQRNNAVSTNNDPPVEPQEATAALTLYADEEVVGLRSEADPYTGLVNCAKRMVAEEGWTVLYRGWWITLLGGSCTLK